MGILGNIMSAIFGSPAAAAPAPGASAGAASPPAGAGGQTAAAAPTGAPASTAVSQVDVEKIMDGLAAKSKQKLDWRKSIVDLMKLLDMDSSLAARKELAKELHYTGDTGDSAKMNIWLHKQVMSKLAENGGKVPDDLRH